MFDDDARKGSEEYSGFGAAAAFSGIAALAITVMLAPFAFLWWLWRKGGSVGRLVAGVLMAVVALVVLLGGGLTLYDHVGDNGLAKRVDAKLAVLEAQPEWLPTVSYDQYRYIAAFQKEWSAFPLAPDAGGRFGGEVNGQWDNETVAIRQSVCGDDHYGLKNHPLPTVPISFICAIPYNGEPTMLQGQALAVFGAELRSRLKQERCANPVGREMKRLCAIPSLSI